MSAGHAVVPLMLILFVTSSCKAVRPSQDGSSGDAALGKLTTSVETKVEGVIDVKLAPGWRLRVPDTFQRSDAGGGAVQLTDGVRTIYFSSMQVSSEGTPASAEGLHEASPARHGAKYELREAGRLGYAHLENESDLLHLKATRESAGSVAVFIATFSSEEDESWAVATWKSIQAPDDVQEEAGSR